MNTLHDIDKLPLPEPGEPGRKRFLAWVELSRPRQDKGTDASTYGGGWEED